MDFYDTRIIKSVSTSIVLDNGEIREISNNFSSGGAVRVLNGGSWGFVSLDGVCGNLDAVISSAGRLAESARNRSPRPPIDLAPITGPGLKDLPEIKEKPQDIPIEDKVKLLLEIEKSAKKTGIQSTNAVYSEALINVKYSSSEGLDCEYTLTRIGFAISSIAQSEGVYQIGRESRFGVMGFEIFKKHDAFALAEKAANTAIELLSAKTPKAGTYPVILDQELAGVFIHEAVGHAVEADHVLEGNSILSGKIGEQIASPLITVYDDPSLHEYGYYPFDDEGAESKRTTLIQNGVLKSFIHSRETAGKLGGESRNSRAQGYSRPVIRMSNTFIAPDGMKFDEMLAELKDGIYLKGSRGGQVNPGEGVFQFNAESGFIVKNGELTTSLRDVSLSGNTLEILNNVSAVGNDLEMNSGRCGKAGQLVPVSDGAPHVLVNKAMVGGSG
ncbi:MAG: TldD/PmbA family protein [Candidatus Methanoperedens sp.]|nr:TldD/PmbA family protein [Candidatus Methanoperedens sp.]CAG0975566.1 TldD protein [Methanosarcinales archaeon]